MAKKGGGKSTGLVGPLYSGGTMNGPVAGPTKGVSAGSPFSNRQSGQTAPSGSPSDRSASSTGERATAH